MEKNDTNQNGKYNSLLKFSIISFIVLFFLFVGSIWYQFTKNTEILNTAINENNKIIKGLTVVNNKKNKNEFVIKNELITNVEQKQMEIYKDFLIKHYEEQHNWLMAWLTILAVVFGILGIGIPLCFMKFFDSKGIEIDKLILKITENKEELGNNLGNVKTLQDTIETDNKNNLKNMQDEIEKLKVLRDEMSKELEKVKDYTQKAKQSEINTNISKFISLANKEINNQNYEEALKYANSIIHLNPQNVDGYSIRGDIYYELKQYNESIQNYDKAIAIKPLYLFYNNRGISYAALKQFDKAIQDYSKAIELNNTKVLSFYNRGLAFQELGKYDESLIDYNRVIQLQQSHEFFSARADLYASGFKDYKSAIKDYLAALSIKTDDYHKNETLYNLIEVYLLDNNISDALKYLKIYIKTTPMANILDDDREKWLSCIDRNLNHTNASEIKKMIIENLKIEKRSEYESNIKHK